MLDSAVVDESTELSLNDWTLCAAELPSLMDLTRAYERVSEFIEGTEPRFISDVAEKVDVFDALLVATIDGRRQCGVIFDRADGLFFFAFGTDEKRTVRLYYTQVESDPLVACSKVALEFGMHFEDQFFDLRDSIVGKHGIVTGEKT